MLGSRGFLVALLLLLIAFVVYAALVPGNGVMQRFNMWRAERHHRVVQPLLDADPRFALVQLGVNTGNNGCMSVKGVVADADALADLRALVQDTDPPTHVRFVTDALDVDAASFAWLVESHQQRPVVRLVKDHVLDRLSEMPAPSQQP